MHTRWRWAAFALLWAAAPPLRADDEYQQLVREFNAAQQKWFEAVSQRNGRDAPPLPVPEFLPRFRAYAEAHAGKPEALPALAWIVSSVRPIGPDAQPPKDVTWAFAQLSAQAADPAIGRMLGGLVQAGGNWGAAAVVPLLEKIYKENPDKDAKAGALFGEGLALYQDERGDKAARDAARAKAARLFRAVEKEFPDSEPAKAAGPYIFEAEHLQVGMNAPDIEGTNENGDPVKLSDFKGRVVVIDFWGFW